MKSNFMNICRHGAYVLLVVCLASVAFAAEGDFVEGFNPSDVISTVYGVPVTAEEAAIFLASGIPFSVDSPETRLSSLRQMINNAVIAKKAEAELPPAVMKTAKIASLLSTDKLWGYAYSRHVIEPTISVTDLELIESAGPQEDNYLVHALVYRDMEIANKSLTEIKTGVGPTYEQRLVTENDSMLLKLEGKLTMTKSYARFPKEVLETILSLKPGELSPLLKTEIGYGIFRVEKVIQAIDVARTIGYSKKQQILLDKMRAKQFEERSRLLKDPVAKIDWDVITEYNKRVTEKKSTSDLLKKPVVFVGAEDQLVVSDFVQVGGSQHSVDILPGSVEETTYNFLVRTKLKEMARSDSALKEVVRKLLISEKLSLQNEMTRAYIAWRGDNIKVGDPELKSYLESHKEEFKKPDRRKLRAIEVFNEKRAKDAIEKFNSGSDFKELAKKLSEHPSKKNGGDLGELGKHQLDAKIAEAVFSAKEGTVAGPFPAKDPQTGKVSYFVLYVEKAFPASYTDYESADKVLLRSRVVANTRSNMLGTIYSEIGTPRDTVLEHEKLRKLATNYKPER